MAASPPSVLSERVVAACGTVRGFVETRRDGIEILGPDGLLAIAAGGGTWWRQEQTSLTGVRRRRMRTR